MAKSFDELAKKTLSKADLGKAKKRAKEIMADLLLSELREAVGPKQKELAQRMGIAQPTLSRLEKQTDMQVSTLQKLVAALGGELEIVARFPKGGVSIRQFDEDGGKSTRRVRKIQLV